MNAVPSFAFLALSPAVTAKIPITMPTALLLFAASTGMVITAPSRIPAWLALGAVVSAVFTLYYAKKTDKTPLYLFINMLAALFLGVAGPRPILHYWMGVADFSVWYPEAFVLLGAGFGMAGFTVINTLHMLITGKLPNLITSLWNKVFGNSPSPPAP